eukprot:TRINITY_DN981_c0_g1_i1.p3 TRINITY_DN981_c0_g1~~TRINITY_DN981_c0_g1_i1.p3  ORF type:complete len:122 (-),score=19.82 TRINITY_DN981_c0_g1_i1:228-593(-)
MKICLKLLFAFIFLTSSSLCLLPSQLVPSDLCGGVDPIEFCCSGNFEYLGDGCCAAVSCLVIGDPVGPVYTIPDDQFCDELDLNQLCCADLSVQVDDPCCEIFICQGAEDEALMLMPDVEP